MRCSGGRRYQSDAGVALQYSALRLTAMTTVPAALLATSAARELRDDSLKLQWSVVECARSSHWYRDGAPPGQAVAVLMGYTITTSVSVSHGHWH